MDRSLPSLQFSTTNGKEGHMGDIRIYVRQEPSLPRTPGSNEVRARVEE